MPDLVAHLPPKLRAWIRPTGTADSRLAASIIRRRKLINSLYSSVPYLWPALIGAGLIYLLALPLDFLGRKHYISENALQPAQVNMYWNWADVHIADKYADEVAKWSLLEPQARSKAIQEAFNKLGLFSATQDYSFRIPSSSSSVNGTNTYAILQAPKTDGAEALILSASWLSRAVSTTDEGDEQRRVNVRGVASVLALANYLKKYSMWSKDIILLISDGYTDGAQAFLDSYHGYDQSTLQADELSLTTGSIWAALNIDYPHHSFSHLGLFYEGVDGHLPNLDIVNSASHIIKHVGITPVLRSATTDPFDHLPSYLRTYLTSATNLMRQVGVGAMGKAPGPEGAYGRYRIDGLTLYAVPAEGPHGFHLLGRVVESTVRSINNLLERLHHSDNLYIMKSVDSFVSVGNYLAAPILISAGLTIYGLWMWAESKVPSLKSVEGGGADLKRELGAPLAIVLATHALGLGLFKLLLSADPSMPISGKIIGTILFLIVATPFLLSSLQILAPPSASSGATAPPRKVLQSITLILSGLAIATVATLNFGASVVLSLLLPLPTIFPSYPIVPVVWYVWMVVGGGGTAAWLRTMLVDWWVSGGSSLAFAMVVVVPLMLQSATTAML